MEVRLLLRYHMGLALREREIRCTQCRMLCDPVADHDLICAGKGDPSRRHDAVARCILQMAQDAGIVGELEAPGLITGSAQRPADILLQNLGGNGRNMAVDVKITNPVALDLLPEAALAGGEARKRRLYGPALRAAGVDFTPFVCSALGGIGEAGEELIASVAYEYAVRKRISQAKAAHLIRSDINYRIARGNATAFIRRQPWAAG
jgi:hypothetical protein